MSTTFSRVASVKREQCHVILEFDFFFLFLFFGFKRTNRDRLSVSLERHSQNPGYQRFRGQQLQRSGMENPRDGLADWFVIKHTRDEALSRELLFKYGFKAADRTQVGIM